MDIFVSVSDFFVFLLKETTTNNILGNMAAIDKLYITDYQQYRDLADWTKSIGTVIDQFGNTITPYEWIPNVEEYDDETGEWINEGEWTKEYFDNWANEIRARNATCYKTEKCWKDKIADNEDNAKRYDSFEKWCEYVDSWKPEIPLWNLGHAEDVWLIKNCPFDFVQDRLREQYGSGWSKTALLGMGGLYEEIKNSTSVFDTFQRKGLKNPHFKIKKLTGDIPFKDDDIVWFIELRDNIGGNYDDKIDQWFFYEECHIPMGDFYINVCDGKYHGNMNHHRIKRILNKWNLPEGTRVWFRGSYHRSLVKNFEVVVKQ